ncbi:hypothetical protein NQ315_014084 [Exocentrus adspersus]|uniref:Endonuclease/exonuclease/phosphatase domain-containing protein n=1 Tax=Exocentrus adspersus TaxID=1586481 RepID=A0AAV8VWE9_9CUCU|nr:hypothetical protein NQ315_014084 [Exocentrus adspersus]
MFGKVEGHSARDSVCPVMIQALEKSRWNVRKVRLEKLDIIAVQEPGSDCKLLGYQTFRAGTERDKVMTLVKNELGRFWTRREKLMTELELRGQNLLFGNLYDEPPGAGNPCRFSEVEEWLRQRQRFVRMIVAGDFNAKHTVWGSPRVDERGDLVHEWSVNRGVGWPDLTLSRTVQIRDRVIDTFDDTLSDHRYVTYVLDLEGVAGRRSRWRFDIKNVDWERFERSERTVERRERAGDRSGGGGNSPERDRASVYYGATEMEAKG